MSIEGTESLTSKLADLKQHPAFQREATPLKSPARSALRRTANSNSNSTNRSNSRRAQFGDITNTMSATAATPNNHVSTHAMREFTPLLKSAVRSSALRKSGSSTTDGAIPPMPDFHQRSPGLPESDYDGPEFSATMDEEASRTSIRGPEPIEDSRSDTPAMRRNHVTGDNVMTLREQEAAIDEMQKENFGLKLKIFFLSKQLKDTTPEGIHQTIEENAEIKTEQVKLRNEMEKLQKQLEESQNKIKELTSNVIADLSSQENLTAEERARIAQLEEENEQMNANLIDAHDALDKLQKEMEEFRRNLDESDSEQHDFKELNNMVEQLEDEVERLKEENRTLQEEVDAKDSELEKKDDELKEANHQIEQLEDTIEAMKSEGEGLGSDDDMKAEIVRLRSQLQDSEEKVSEYKQKAEQSAKDLQELLSGGAEESVSPQKTQKLEDEICELKTKNSRLESELSRTKSDQTIGNVEKKVRELEKKSQKSSAAERRINESYVDQETIADFQQQLNEEAELKETARHRADELAKQNRTLTKEINELKKEIRQKNSEMKKMMAEVSSKSTSKNAADEAQARLSAAHAELEAIQSRQDELQSAYDKLAEERDTVLEALQKTKQEFVNSKNVFKRKMAAVAEKLAESKKQPVESASSRQELESILEELQTQHRAELNALALQIRYLRAKAERDQWFRNDCAFMKRFFLMQIGSFEACNQANLFLLEEMGIYPEKKFRNKRPTLKAVGTMLIASIRMRNLQKERSNQHRTKMILSRSLDMVRQRREDSEEKRN